MKHFCVIGDPVEHSLSPRLHRRMIELTGLDATYDLCPVRAQELERFVEQARGGAWDGFNVTMPHKEAIVPYLDGLSGTAARCRAVNTVCMEDGRAIGHNTDGLGFIESLRAHGFDPADKTALIIGTGGAGEAVTDALVQAGARLVYICNRSVYRAGPRRALSRAHQVGLFRDVPRSPRLGAGRPRRERDLPRHGGLQGVLRPALPWRRKPRSHRL